MPFTQPRANCFVLWDRINLLSRNVPARGRGRGRLSRSLSAAMSRFLPHSRPIYGDRSTLVIGIAAAAVQPYHCVENSQSRSSAHYSVSLFCSTCFWLANDRQNQTRKYEKVNPVIRRASTLTVLSAMVWVQRLFQSF